MDKDVDRREYMESQLPNHFEQYHRIPGFNGKKIKDKYHDTIDGVEFYNEFENNSLSEIGCTLSHLLAIKTAYENGDEIACIMEDDVYMNLLNIKDESLDEFIKNIHIEWEILKLFHLDSTGLNKEFIPIKKHNFHLFNDDSNSTVCYLINRKGMEKILSIMGHNPFYLMKYMGATCVADYILYNQVKTYDIEPSLVTINNTKLDSTIHTDHTSNHIEMSLKKLEKYKEDILSKCCSFLNIIIYNENENYERLMKKEIETYLKKFKNVIHYFVTYRDQNDYIIIEDNCIYIKGSEGFVPQCLDKTIIAIDYCINQLNIQFDFLVRSNISTMINFNHFPIELPLTNCYTSALIIKINPLDIINKLRGLQFASGTNIIMSKDVVKYLVDHKYELDRTIIDDVSIGFLLSKHFKPIQIKQEKKMIINEIDKDAFVIRNKSNNRYDDVSRMMKLNKKNQD
jgi:GR25 family glycosyltransferase involved in LPS biosynthesis